MVITTLNSSNETILIRWLAKNRLFTHRRRSRGILAEDSHYISARISWLHDKYVSLRFRSSSSLSKTSASPQSIQTSSFEDAKTLFVSFALPGK